MVISDASEVKLMGNPGQVVELWEKNHERCGYPVIDQLCPGK